MVAAQSTIAEANHAIALERTDPGDRGCGGVGGGASKIGFPTSTSAGAAGFGADFGAEDGLTISTTLRTERPRAGTTRSSTGGTKTKSQEGSSGRSSSSV